VLSGGISGSALSYREVAEMLTERGIQGLNGEAWRHQIEQKDHFCSFVGR
jgi:hypothetical protein